MAERRIARRWSRHLHVRFWQRGDQTEYSGHTTNISNTGAFVATARLLGRGARVRLEIGGREGGFVVEGIVARTVSVPPQFQRIRQGGIGVRFLRVEELVGELIPQLFQKRTTTTREAPRPTTEPTAPPSTPSPKPPALDLPAPFAESTLAEPGTSEPQPNASSSSQLEVGTPVPSPYAEFLAATSEPAASSEPTDTPEPPSSPGLEDIVGTGKRYPIQFADRGSFRIAYERDIKGGGIFVPTPAPSPLRSAVTLVIRVGEDNEIEVPARVVHVSEPSGEGGGTNLMCGMGVEFANQADAVLLLRSLLFD